MKIIFANGQYIKLDSSEFKSEAGYRIWGYRWNRNEQRWGQHCTLHTFNEYKWVDESELPGKLKEIDTGS